VRFASDQQDSDKASFSICECVYLRVAPSARAANGLLLLPTPSWISPFSAIDQRTAAALSGLTALARQTGGFPKKPKSQANHLWIWRKTPGAGAGGISPYVVYAASALILTSRVGCAAAARTERRQHASDAISDNHVIVDSFAHGMWCRTHQSLTWR